MSETVFLSERDVITYTGYSQLKKQKAYCEKHGIPFITNGRGRLVIAREAVTGKPKGKPKENRSKENKRWQSPNERIGK